MNVEETMRIIEQLRRTEHTRSDNLEALSEHLNRMKGQQWKSTKTTSTPSPSENGSPEQPSLDF